MLNRDTLIQENRDLGLTVALYDAMHSAGIDIPLALERIRRANRGDFDSIPPIRAKNLPQADDSRLFDPDNYTLTVSLEEARQRISSFNLPFSPDLETMGTVSRDRASISLQSEALGRIGLLLAPITAFGALNGGSASSYLDRTRIAEAYPALLNIYADILPQCEALCMGQPKGCTPAYWNPDGTAGFEFMALKSRALLIRKAIWAEATGIRDNIPLYPMFEMTSHLTHDQLRSVYRSYPDSELLAALCEETGWDPASILSAQQPLLAAMSVEKPYTIFDQAWGKKDCPLPMPGGHGHSFYVLRDIYRNLYDAGIRFVCMGNIDNSGLLVNDRALAVLALTGKQGCFEFSLKTEADIKGGILVEDENGRLNCGDISLAISPEEVAEYELKNTPILFNAAGGLFNLEWLVHNLERIIRDLPARLTVQEKDRGCYTQSEQVTWEVLGMMDDKLICKVNKYQRFIAAKMVVEMLMASRMQPRRITSPLFPDHLKKVASNLQQGLATLLAGPYGLKLTEGRWTPLTPKEIRDRIL